ncbi:MAG TPA: DUF721 domain-containing protein [Thermodesulfobacteriota bacterium]|nr:DUF721 domain-containing protein [Thermodesulfobacteriota bacterium]
MKKPQSIRSVLENTLKSLEIDVPLKSYSILETWNEIVGATVAAHSQPRSIRNRILFIDVTHSTWMQQLQFLKPTLLEKVNNFLGEPLIQDIRFKLGKILPSTPSPSETDPWRKEDLAEETLKRIEKLIQKVEDGEVRIALKEVLTKGAKLEQSRMKP